MQIGKTASEYRYSVVVLRRPWKMDSWIWIQIHIFIKIRSIVCFLKATLLQSWENLSITFFFTNYADTRLFFIRIL